MTLKFDFQQNEVSFFFFLSHLSALSCISNDRAELVKLYPEQDITVRFKKRGHGTVYAYCNRDGLFSRRL